MMSRICLAALAFALSVTSVSFAIEPEQSFGSGGPYDLFAAPTPSGLRFSGADTTIHTKSLDGGPGTGSCDTCGAGGICVDWKLVSWHGSWDDPQPHDGGHGRSCGPVCGD